MTLSSRMDYAESFQGVANYIQGHGFLGHPTRVLVPCFKVFHLKLSPIIPSLSPSPLKKHATIAVKKTRHHSRLTFRLSDSLNLLDFLSIYFIIAKTLQ